jgi:hypothetical protein
MTKYSRATRIAGAAGIVLGIVLAATPAASADQVRLKSGEVVEGLSRREPGKVIVETRLGTLTYPADQVQDIAPGRTPMNDYVDRLTALGPSPKAVEVFALALWAREQGLVRYVHPLVEWTIRIDPNFAEAHRLLDEVQMNGQWVTRSERDARQAAATEALRKAEHPERRSTRVRPKPEMDPGYTYLGFPPMVPRRGSQAYFSGYGGGADVVITVRPGIAVLP